MAEKKEKVAPTPEQKAARRAARRLAFQTWRQEWKAANPNGTSEERKAAWSTAMTAEIRKARKALRGLEKGGFKVVPVEA